MRILHTEASCGWGGQEIRILSEAQGMIERGHQVCLVCPPEARIHSEAARFGVPVEALPIGRKNWRGVAAMRDFLSRRQFDVINTHSSTDSWLVALAKLFIDRAPPLVRTRHISAPLSANFATRWLYARATDSIATTGEALREQLMAALPIDPQRIVSVPTGIDTERYCPVSSAEKGELRHRLALPDAVPLIGIVATLRSWKGHRFLIEALTREVCSTTHLVIVGDGPQADALAAQVKELGLDERVHLVGNHPDVVPWLQVLDIFVLPSYANEGIPQALMQAMSSSLPCITTAVGAIPEIAIDGETALVVKPQDADAIASALNRLLSDVALCNQLGQVARQRIIEAHGRSLMLDRMEALFVQASGRRVG